MGLPDAPPVALNIAAGAPITTGEAGAKPVMVCGFNVTKRVADAAAICPPMLDVTAPIGKFST